MPAVAAAAEPDPIYRLIEGHRRAWNYWSEAVAVEAVIKPNDPRERSAAAECQRRADIDAQPTTIEGVAALAEYVVELRNICVSELSEDNYVWILQDIARMLRKMATA